MCRASSEINKMRNIDGEPVTGIPVVPGLYTWYKTGFHKTKALIFLDGRLHTTSKNVQVGMIVH